MQAPAETADRAQRRRDYAECLVECDQAAGCHHRHFETVDDNASTVVARRIACDQHIVAQRQFGIAAGAFRIDAAAIPGHIVADRALDDLEDAIATEVDAAALAGAVLVAIRDRQMTQLDDRAGVAGDAEHRFRGTAGTADDGLDVVGDGLRAGRETADEVEVLARIDRVRFGFVGQRTRKPDGVAAWTGFGRVERRLDRAVRTAGAGANCEDRGMRRQHRAQECGHEYRRDDSATRQWRCAVRFLRIMK